MRVLLLVDCYLPSAKSGAKLMHDLAVEMRRRGHDVVVMTPSDSIRDPIEVVEEDGVRVARARVGRIKGAGKVLRAIREARLSSVLWRAGRRFLEQNPRDLIVWYSPSIFFGALVARLKDLWRCPAYLVLRDIFPQWAVDAGLLGKGLVWRYFRAKELFQYGVADAIGVQSPGNLRYFAESLPGRTFPLEVLYNWTTLDEGEVPRRDFRRQLGLGDKVVFFYGGNIGVAQDMDNIVRLAASVRDEAGIAFLLVGEGSEVPRLKRRIEEEGLPNLRILPAVDQREYLSMLSEADVGLISLSPSLTTQNLPGKMLGYMYFSIPMLASLNPGNDLGAILDRHEAGRWCVNGQDDAFRAHALELARDGALRRRLGENGRRLLETTFSVEAAASRILGRFPPH